MNYITPQQEKPKMTQKEWLRANGIEYETDGNGRVVRAWSSAKAPLVTTNIETGGLMVREDFLLWLSLPFIAVFVGFVGFLIFA